MMPTLQLAMDHHRQGRLAEAERAYRSILANEPSQFEALHLCGVLHLQQGNAAEAFNLISQAVEIQPSSLEALSNLSAALLSLNWNAEAVKCCDRILNQQPGDVSALFNRGVALNNLELTEDALDSYDKALAINPNHFNALFNRGVLLARLDRNEQSLADFSRLATLVPGSPDVLSNRGNVEAKLGRYADALTSYDLALAAKPGFIQALTNRSNVLRLLDRPTEALVSLDRALAIDPVNVDGLTNRGNLLMQLNRPLDALACFDRLVNLGRADASVLTNRAYVLLSLDRWDEALDCCEQAIAKDINFANAFVVRGHVFKHLGRDREAANSYERARALEPDHPFAFCELILCHLSACRWDKVDGLVQEVREQFARGKAILMPFALLPLPVTASEQLQNARTVVRERLPPGLEQFPKRTVHTPKKITLAYVSGDMLIRHPIAHLIPELIERHDRSQFDVIGISHGLDDGSPERERVQKAFDKFLDVQNQSDLEIASTLHDLQVDIAIDLSGYTERGRTYLLAHRPAPIQVSYLGYPGTTGADFVDYIIADKTVLPFDQQPYYTEKIVHLPDGFMVCDAKRTIPRDGPSRSDAGLPQDGFVFCSFNASYKINASVFDIWMRLLQRVEGSVLWLLRSNDDAVASLRQEAERRGVDSNRIIFAPKLPPADHLARIPLADLFLDTRPVNAGATAIDALSVGLPVLTCTGDTFVSRVAASILHAAGLSELVTDNAQDYESLAVRLATDQQHLRSIRAKVEATRSIGRLFDTDRFRRHIKSAFSTMHAIHLRGETPQSFHVNSID